MHQDSIEVSLEYRNAAAAGALCCTAYDSVSGLLPLKEIRSRILAGWEKSW